MSESDSDESELAYVNTTPRMFRVAHNHPGFRASVGTVFSSETEYAVLFNMAEGGDRSSSEQPTSPDATHTRFSDAADGPSGEGAGAPGGELSLMEPSPQQPAGEPPAIDPAVEKQFDAVIHSDIGVEVLLGRMKQCISGHRDLATFFKEMGVVYEKHAHGQKKVVRTTIDSVRSGERKHGQYATQLEEVMRRMDLQADYYAQFGLKCSGMWEELTESVKTFDDRRKTEKQNGLAAEKRAQGAEEEMLKARHKRDRLADDLDKVKTGDRQGRGFGRLGTRSQAQQEEDLTRKLQAADSDYQQKTQNAQAVRQNLLQSERPATVNRMLQMIRELDAQVCLQMGFYVKHLEDMLTECGWQLFNKDVPQELAAAEPGRLMNRVTAIDQESDFKTYVNSFAPRVGNTHRELKYEPHHTQRGPTNPPQQPQGSGGPNNFRSASGPLPNQMISPPPGGPPPHQRTFSGPQGPALGGGPPGGPLGGPPAAFPGPPHLQTTQPSGGSFMGPGEHPFVSSPNDRDPRPGSSGAAQIGGPMESGYQNGPGLAGDPRPGYGHSGPVLPQQPGGPLGPYPPQQPGGPPGPYPPQQRGGPPRPGPPGQGPGAMVSQPPPATTSPGGRALGPPLAPDRPTFNQRLQVLYERDGSPVPILVHQCLQAVDMFGLEVDGIYRQSGSAQHIARLRQMFDHDPTTIDFRFPENFFQDINSVTGLLKQFLRDLPGGLLTDAYYRDFIGAAKIEDADARRDQLHSAINALPDANYATLRALCLHLWRVQEHEAVNRMTSANLAICFGPTILVPASNRDLADAGWQVKAMETIFANTLQIFDDD